MVDLHTPPPSYETATERQNFVTDVAASVDENWSPDYSSNDTTPILPPSLQYREPLPTPQYPPAYRPTVYPVILLNNAVNERQQSFARTACYIFLYFCLIGVIVLVALTLKGTNSITVPKYELSQYSDEELTLTDLKQR